MLDRKKTALVTGASGGIGHAIAEAFARDGINLIITARNATEIRAVAAQMQAQYGVQALGLAAELGVSDGAQLLFDAIKAAGLEIDFLVNNAGVGSFGEFKNSALASEQAMMILNMHAPTVLTKLFLPEIMRLGGKIMHVASTASFQPGPYMAVYYASKSFLLAFSEALAEELRDSGVSVTALCPGPTKSGFQHKAAMHDSALVRGKKLPTAESVGQAGYRAMMQGKRVYIPGVMNWLLAQSIRYTPRSLVTKMVRMMSAPIS
jgi:uncharacterized protein